MIKNLKFAFLLIFILSASRVYSDEAKPVFLYVGQTKNFSVNTPTRVVIDNPNIIDVTSVSRDNMLVAAKNPGTTGFAWSDESGQHSLQVQVFQENMSLVKQRIDLLLKELKVPDVLAQSSNNEGKVLLLGSVKTPADLERIDVALSSLKGKIVNLIQLKEEKAIIEINVQVLELNKDATSTLGLSFPGSIDITEIGSPALGALGTTWGKLFKVSNLTRDAFTLTLDALVQEGKARVLSQPRLACQSGKEAELLVGGEKPIFNTTVAATTGATGTNIEYKEYGIKLKIKPTVTEDKQIKLALNVEVSDVGTAETIGSTSTGTTTAKAYPLSRRNASTQLFLNDGQMMAIGGLIKQKSEEDIRKTPFLGDMPVLGVFFRKKTTTAGGGQGERGDTELMITLTTTIIKEPASGGEPKEQAKLSSSNAPAGKEKSKNAAAAPLPDKNKPASPAKTAQQALSEYMLAISKRIQNNFVYPGEAKQQQKQGTVRLGLRLASTGALLDVKIIQSSGYNIFDENAVSIVKRLSPYPLFPVQLDQKELLIDLPIVYKLE